ncbi:MAG: beta-L-arabinofuranosidase domain-containing protein [Pirellulales bacterium]
MRAKIFAVLICFVGWGGTQILARADQESPSTLRVEDAIHPVVPDRVGGILGERLDAWRHVRLWRVVNDPFLLDGFTHPPGEHPWQGEHVGKWLHAASLAGGATGDPKLNEALRAVAAKLIAAQETNGYLGTYALKERYYSKVSTGDPTTWDIWTQRYAIHGLLSYCSLHDDPAALRASKKAGELLMKTVGPPSGDVTRFGTRHGLSSAVLLESIVMLYRQTGDDRYLDFAKHIVRNIEQNPDLRIMAAMRAGEDVTAAGDGKAYQLMAVLLGYVELFRSTGEREYLDTAVMAWERILADHVNVAGGPWSYQVKRTTNQECFAPPQYFHPTNCVETCSTTTWIQLCLSLFELTGEARYADAAEVSIFNQLLGAQSPNGNDWAYHSMLNMPDRGYEDAITCCASSGPRALELYARHLICVEKERLVVNSYVPGVFSLGGASGVSGRVVMEGDYPLAPECTIRIELPAPTTFAVDFRLPAGASALEMKVNGVAHEPEQTSSGFLRVHRAWNSGDRVALKFDFPLRADFQTASDGVRWVAFRWGPLALAQSVVKQTDHPQNVLLVEQESEDGNHWLEAERATGNTPLPSDNATEELDTSRASAAASAQASVPSWRLKTPRKIIMVPYFQAGGEGGGVRTMFPTRRSL